MTSTVTLVLEVMFCSLPFENVNNLILAFVYCKLNSWDSGAVLWLKALAHMQPGVLGNVSQLPPSVPGTS